MKEVLIERVMLEVGSNRPRRRIRALRGRRTRTALSLSLREEESNHTSQSKTIQNREGRLVRSMSQSGNEREVSNAQCVSSLE